MAEEMIDVYTPRGVWTGETLPKSEVHARGLWHPTTHGVITNGRGSIITQFRGPDVKMMRNVRDIISVAGHISALTEEERQDPNKRDLIWQAWRALRREFQEELGIELPDDMLFSDDCVMFGITRTNQQTEAGWWDRSHSANFMLTMPDLDPTTFKLEAGKVLDVKWQDTAMIEYRLRTGDGEPFAVREPDYHQLMQGTIDCARRVMNNRIRRGLS